VLLPRQQAKLARGAKDKEYAMSQTPNTAIAVIGIDIGKNSFHVVGHDARGAIVLRHDRLSCFTGNEFLRSRRHRCAALRSRHQKVRP
jgi:hypothetical protein